jgi:hypothetical protein
VIQIGEDLERLRDDGVGFASFDVDDEADSASFVLKLGIVQALSGRQTRPQVFASAPFFLCAAHQFRENHISNLHQTKLGHYLTQVGRDATVDLRKVWAPSGARLKR